MKLIIAGSREITDIRVVRKAIEESGINLSEVTEIVSGTARGVDKFRKPKHGITIIKLGG